MATETLSPDSLLLQVNLSGTVSDIQDDPDSPDGNWLTAGSHTVSTICHVSFPTPSGDLTTGAGVQEFRVLWRTSSTGDTPDQIQIHLFEGGTSVTLNLVNVPNPAGQPVYSATWNAADLSNIDGSGVECYVLTTADTSPPPQVATGEIGAIEWNVVYDVSSQTITDVPFISSGNTVFAASVLASDYNLSDLNYISPSNTLYNPDVLPQEYTITDVDYISPSSQLFDPSVNLITRIDDLDYISPSNILYDPTTQLSYTVSDLDYITPSNTLYDPSIQLSYTITDLDYIPPSNSLHVPAVGRKPKLLLKEIITPRIEGDVVVQSSLYYNWIDATTFENVGDLPDGLSFGNIGTVISYLSGTLSDVSAGTYNIQHSATGPFGTTLSSIDEFVVKLQ